MLDKLKKGVFWFGKYQTRKKLFSFAFVTPWIIGFLALTLYPLTQTILYSFSTTKVLPDTGLQATFVGLENYKEVLFVKEDFRVGIISYLQIIVFLVPIIVVFALIIAVLLNIKMKGKRIFRAIYFLPVILTSGPLLSQIRSMGALEVPGIQNFVVYRFIEDNLPGVVSTPVTYILLHFVFILWFSGVQILILLSALQKVDNNIYQAAMVDGATSWQAFFEITIPILRPFILLNAIYTIVDLSTSSLNPFQGLIINNRYGHKSGFGYSAAASWLFFLLELVMIVAAFLLLRQRNKKPRGHDA